jgi:hypothetical protein
MTLPAKNPKSPKRPRGAPRSFAVSEHGPFRVWAGVGRHRNLVIIPFSKSYARRTLTREQIYSLNVARQHHVKLRGQVLGWLRRKKISSSQYSSIQKFVREFTFSLREVEGKMIYRAPAVEEIFAQFPFLEEKFVPVHLKNVKRKLS